MGEYEAARSHLEQALVIRRQVLGPEDPDTAQSFNNLGILSLYEKDYQVAIKYMRQALPIWQRVVGPHHPYTETACQNLAAIEKKLLMRARQRAIEDDCIFFSYTYHAS